MPKETEKTNTEIVRELYGSFAEGDLETIRTMMNPNVELHEPRGFIDGGTHHGFNEIAENVFSRLGNEWEDVSVVPERFVEGGDTVVALLTWSGTYSESGKSVKFPSAHVFDPIARQRQEIATET